MLNIRWPGTAVSDRRVVASVAKAIIRWADTATGLFFTPSTTPLG